MQGGAMSGNCVMGKVASEIIPNRVSITDTTVESTGRSINFFNMK
jgi:hypothetical protein